MLVFHNGSTGYVNLRDFYDEIDREYPETATVTFTLFNQNDGAITDATDVAMAKVSGTSGRNTVYRGEVPATVTLPIGTEGTCIITATYGGKVRKFPEAARFED